MIAKYFAPLASHDGALGLRDDVAIIAADHPTKWIISTDMMVELTHFTADLPAKWVARRALRAALSDLAAKNAEPVGYFLSIALAPHARDHWLKDFAAGLKEDQAIFGISLLGGDTVASEGLLTVNITVIGYAAETGIPRRQGAKSGDYIGVTGTLGDGALGLKRWYETRDMTREEVQRYVLPNPRFAEARVIAPFAHAMMDISDGLLQDLGHICTQSEVGAEIFLDQVPCSSAMRTYQATKATDWQQMVLGGGDDYELLFTCDPASALHLRQLAKEQSLAIHFIGLITDGNEVRAFSHQGGEAITGIQPGYQHLAAHEELL